MEQQVSVALCIPTLGPPTWTLFDSVGQWMSYHYQRHPEIAVTVIRPPRPLPIGVARSYLVREFLKGEWDYLWFIDQDAAFTIWTLERLMAWDVPVVGGLCLMRGPEACKPMLFKGQQEDRPDYYRIPVDVVYDYLRIHADVETNAPQVVDPIPEGSLFEVDFTGCHCLLIKREVLAALEPPWFYGQPGREDKFFCLKAAEAGYPVAVDLSTFVGHTMGERVIGVYDYMAQYLYMSLLEGIDVGIANRTTEAEE